MLKVKGLLQGNFSGEGKAVLLGMRSQVFEYDVESCQVSRLLCIPKLEQGFWDHLFIPEMNSWKLKTWFLINNNGGQIAMLDRRTSRAAAKFEVGNGCQGVTVDTMGGRLVAAVQNQLVIWDLRKQNVLETIKIPHVADICCLGNTRKHLAIGECSGVITVAGWENLSRPTKSFKNLRTKVTGLCGKSESSLLVGYARDLNRGLRLFDVENKSVYERWPRQSTPIKKVCAVALGEFDRTYLAVGNTNSRVFVYRIGD